MIDCSNGSLAAGFVNDRPHFQEQQYVQKNCRFCAMFWFKNVISLLITVMYDPIVRKLKIMEQNFFI